MAANNVNLKLLQTFLLAAEYGSFRRAAEESNRSPSAVSMQIRDLEEQVEYFHSNTEDIPISIRRDDAEEKEEEHLTNKDYFWDWDDK